MDDDDGLQPPAYLTLLTLTPSTTRAVVVAAGAAAATSATAVATSATKLSGAVLGVSHCAPRSRHAPDKTTRMSSPYQFLQHRRRHHCRRHLPSLRSFSSLLLLFAFAECLLYSPGADAAPDAYYGDSDHHVSSRSGPGRPEPQRQMVCNNGTDYRCICRAAEPPDTAEPVPGIIECDEFIQVQRFFLALISAFIALFELFHFFFLTLNTPLGLVKRICRL